MVNEIQKNEAILIKWKKECFMTKVPVYVSLEFTPNPSTLKYTVNRQLLKSGTVNFPTRDALKDQSPLAEKIFEVAGVEAVMIGKDFVTVTKSEAGDWDKVHQGASKVIQSHLEAELPVVAKEHLEEKPSDSSDDTDVVKRIKEILDQEIRPAVAQDGGDITFERYEQGVVYLHLQGACSGCPSATMTLKVGIENRLREEIPEIQEVVSV